MKVLIDTHVFLWWIMDDPRLSKKARLVMKKGDNDLYLSCASIWEMSIKMRTGKLTMPGSDLLFVSDHLERNSITPLPVFLHHAIGVHRLPLLHRDPFDRMLIAQSLAEDMPIVSADEQIARYDVKVIW